MKIISKLKLLNFKKYRDFEVDFTEGINLLIGDNEAGKSTILQAIDLVLSTSKSKIESGGVENFFNQQVIEEYSNLSSKNYADLPIMRVELYLDGEGICYKPELNGKNNSINIRVC